MAYINLPNKFSQDRVKQKGIILKNTNKLVLADLYATDTKDVFELTTVGMQNYIVDVYDTYLFIISDKVNGAIVKPNKVDYLSKIIKFEYLFRTSSTQIKKLDIKSNILTLILKERWLDGSVLRENIEDVCFITNNIKTHLKGCQTPYIKQMLFLQDNDDGFGMSEYALSKNLLIENYVLVLKDTSFGGYIIKYCHSDFDGNFM